MNLQDMSWDVSTMGSEEHFDNMAVLNRKPFLCAEEEYSDELVESTCQENPFLDFQPDGVAHRKLICSVSSRYEHRENWVERVRRLTSQSSIVRSAPQPRDSHWNEVESGEVHTLPVLGLGTSDSISRISADVAASLILNEIERDFIFVDARFSYEYEGGHVIGALNLNDIGKAKKLLKKPRLVIFYCEYSSARAPALARSFRNVDRKMSVYPALQCPEIYVLEGGYSNFYNSYAHLCSPQEYVRMHDKRFVEECAEECRKRKKENITFDR